MNMCIRLLNKRGITGNWKEGDAGLALRPGSTSCMTLNKYSPSLSLSFLVYDESYNLLDKVVGFTHHVFLSGRVWEAIMKSSFEIFLTLLNLEPPTWSLMGKFKL